MIISATGVADDYQERNYVISKPVYPQKMTVDALRSTPAPTFSVNKGKKVKMKVLIPAGLNQIYWRAASNTFQYGVRLGASPEDIRSSSGSSIILYNSKTKSKQHYKYIYIDNSNGRTDFGAIKGTGFVMYSIDNITDYNKWCASSCYTKTPVYSNPRVSYYDVFGPKPEPVPGELPPGVTCSGLDCLKDLFKPKDPIKPPDPTIHNEKELREVLESDELKVFFDEEDLYGVLVNDGLTYIGEIVPTQSKGLKQTKPTASVNGDLLTIQYTDGTLQTFKLKIPGCLK